MSESLKQTTARGFVWAALGGGAQQLVMLVIGILLARTLDVSDYGLVGMLTVFSLLAGNLQESGFTATLAVRREASREDYNAVFWFSTGMGVFLYTLLYICAPAIAAYNHTPQLTLLARVIFLGFVASAIGTAPAAFLFRELKVRERTTSQVTASLLSGIVGLAMAYGGCGCWSLVGMDLCYKVTYASLVWYFSRWRPLWMSPAVVWGRIKPLLSQSLSILATNILNTLSTQLVQSLLGGRYTPHQVGLYAQALKWQTLGQQLLSGTVGAVAQPVLGRVADDSERQQRVLLTMLRFTAFMSFPALIGFAYVSPELIPLLIKDKWTACVPLLQMLCLAGSTVPLTQTLANLVIARQRAGLFFGVNGVLLVMQITAFIFVGSGNLSLLVLIISTIILAGFPVWSLVCRVVCGIRLRGILWATIPYAAATVTAILLCRLCGVVHFWFQIPVVAALYIALLALFRNRTLHEAAQYVFHKGKCAQK